MTIYGCKLLTDDLRSACQERVVQYSTEWMEVPGNGAYVAITGGLTSGGTAGTRLVYLECDGPTGADAPDGVTCFRLVRIVPDCPERVTPEMRGVVACDAPGLTSEQRIALAKQSTPEWRGRVACDAPGLTAEQRVKLAEQSTAELRGWVARYADGLTAEQRVSLAEQSTLELRGRVARYAPGLTSKQRIALAEQSTPEWRGLVARYADWLTSKQRARLRG
jgi:hypothetical protein